MIQSLILTMIRGYQWLVIVIVILLVLLPFIRKCVDAFKEGMNGDDGRKNKDSGYGKR